MEAGISRSDSIKHRDSLNRANQDFDFAARVTGRIRVFLRGARALR